MKTMMTRLAAAAALFVLPVTADAAVTWNVQNGRLMGASGVMISGQTYDVSFGDGSCDSLYGRCNQSEMAFASKTAAEAAGTALFQQVFQPAVIGGISYDFKKNPAVINGCETSTSSCSLLLPFERYVSGTTTFVNILEIYKGKDDNDTGMWSYGLTADFNTAEGLGSNYTFAKFNLAKEATIPAAPAPAVPEPATWALMLAGFGLTAAAMRRRRRAGAVAAVA